MMSHCGPVIDACNLSCGADVSSGVYHVLSTAVSHALSKFQAPVYGELAQLLTQTVHSVAVAPNSVLVWMCKGEIRNL